MSLATILGLFVVVVELSKQTKSRLDLQVSFTEHLEMTNVEHRVGTQILRMHLVTGQYTSEKFGPRRPEPPVHVVSKDDEFAFVRLRTGLFSRNLPFDLSLG